MIYGPIKHRRRLSERGAHKECPGGVASQAWGVFAPQGSRGFWAAARQTGFFIFARFCLNERKNPTYPFVAGIGQQLDIRYAGMKLFRAWNLVRSVLVSTHP